jgi:biopolymer transport protein ExbD
MKIRKQGGAADKVELQMTPMIDVVFQLLIFFLFSFKIVPVEGEIGVNMPPITSGSAKVSDDVDPVEKARIRLVASESGELANILLGEKALGIDAVALTTELKQSFVGAGGKAGDVEVEVDADRTLRYFYVIRVTNAIMRAGIEKINFADRPKTSG